MAAAVGSVIGMGNRHQTKSFNILCEQSDIWDVPLYILEAANDRICSVISYSINISATNDDVPLSNGGSHLDSHTNMCLFGKYCYVISCSGKFCDVSGFSDGIGKLQKVPAIGAVITYNCSITY